MFIYFLGSITIEGLPIKIYFLKKLSQFQGKTLCRPPLVVRTRGGLFLLNFHYLVGGVGDPQLSLDVVCMRRADGEGQRRQPC